MKRTLLAALLCLGFLPALAQSPAPDAADLLFEGSHWETATAGSTIGYRYQRTSGNAETFGPSFEDRIRLKLEAGESAANRTVRVELFTPPRYRPAGPFEDVPGNPVVVLFLEHHLATLAGSLKANPRYFKQAIRAGLRDKASVEPVKLQHGGREVEGWRVAVKPFADDRNREKMRGLDSFTYVFTVSNAVPGRLVSIEAEAKAADGSTLLKETLTHDAAS
jgi:hypothetical protein